MDLYLILGGLMALALCCMWFFRQGRANAQTDVMQEINSDALLAKKANEQTEAMSSDGVRAALRSRVRRPF